MGQRGAVPGVAEGFKRDSFPCDERTVIDYNSIPYNFDFVNIFLMENLEIVCE
jgi:hypothetical protein